MTYYLDNDNIELIKELITVDYEVCGHLEEEKKNVYEELSNILNIIPITLVQQNTGKNESKKMCVFKYYKKMLWHTHGVNSKGYPSVEDILKSIKNANKIKRQLIFTKFGIWELYTLLIDEDINKLNKNERKQIIIERNIERNIIEILNDNIYNNFYKGKDKEKYNEINVSVDNIKYIYKCNNKLIELLKKYKFYISFVPWYVIDKMDVYIL
jgi:inner membrane protein involved in colicin E2 resistance